MARCGASTGPSANPKSPQLLSGVGQLSTKYKGVLLDQFGVLHDGRAPYPNAIETVRQMSRAGQDVLILSNSSRRSSGALGKLSKLGFDEDNFVGAITSGEVTHQSLVVRRSDWWRSLGSTCLHFTWGARGAVSLDGLSLTVTTSPEEAEFIIAHGTEAIGQGDGVEPLERTLVELEAVLAACANLSRPIPMLVANPDFVTVNGNDLVVMPGTLARKYADLGGEVHLMGKPAEVIYSSAMQILGLQASEVVAIGDSLEHDIRGAQGARVASVFVCGGIHAKETLDPDGNVDMDGLKALCVEYDAWPDYIVPML